MASRKIARSAGSSVDVKTIKRRKFVELYLQIDNATEAHAQIYGGLSSRKSHARNAVHLLEEPDVQAYMVELRSKTVANVMKKLEINLENVTEMLLADRDLARATKQPSAAIAAVLGLAKLYGLVEDRIATRNETYVVGMGKDDFESDDAFDEILRQKSAANTVPV